MCGIGSYFLARSYDRKPIFWGAMGLLTGPIGVLILFYLTSTTPALAQETFEDSVRFFQELGLLEKKQKYSLKTTVTDISNAYREDWGTEFDNNDPLADLMLLKYSNAKAWWEDTEADVLQGNDVYENTIKEWANISRDVFAPANIVENWQSSNGPITITFTLEGEEISIKPKFLDDYIDVNILRHVNELIKHTDKQFEMYKPFDQTAFVICLTNGEKNTLKKRGWKFFWQPK